MHLLAFIIWFIGGSVSAAIKGDMSGVKVIGEIVFTFMLLYVIALLLVNPVLLVMLFVICILLLIGSRIK